MPENQFAYQALHSTIHEICVAEMAPLPDANAFVSCVGHGMISRWYEWYPDPEFDQTVTGE
jgi:hypothetical protein